MLQISTPTYSPQVQTAWIDWRNILSLYDELLTYSRIEFFWEAKPTLSENEKGLLAFAYSLRQGSRGTIEVYIQKVCSFINFCRVPFYQASVHDANAFLDELVRGGRSKSTLNLYFAALRSFYKAMKASGLSPVNPVELIGIPKITKSAKVSAIFKKSLSQEEVDKILKYLEREYQARDTLIFYFLARTGIRVSELTSLKWKNLIHSMGKWGIIVTGKGDKERTIVLPYKGAKLVCLYRFGEFGVPLDNYSHPHIDELPIFGQAYDKAESLHRSTINKLLKRISQDTGVKPFSPHALRHTCFTQLVHLGTPINSIKLLAGHESINTTSIYIDAGETLSSGATAFDQIEK